MQTLDKCKRFFKQHFLVCGFFALLILPYPLWALLSPYLDTTNYENRSYASFPTLQTTSIPAFPAAIESWIEDNAPFRNQLMSYNAALNWHLGTLDSADVLRGKQDWLFLKDSADSNSLSDYQGLTCYSEAEQAEILSAIQTLSDTLADYDCKLAVLLAPAKEGVYHRYMPDSIVVTGPTRVETLVNYHADGLADQENTALIWPKEALQDLATRQTVYYKYDTHWNEVGGWLASQSVLCALEMPYHSQDPKVMVDETTLPPNDLADVSATWNLCTDDVFYTLDEASADYTWVTEEGNLAQLEGSGNLDLLMIRDSFGDAMMPYLAEGFASTTVLHGNLLKEDILIAYDIDLPDVLLIEVGERFSDNLLSRLNQAIALVPTLTD